MNPAKLVEDSLRRGTPTRDSQRQLSAALAISYHDDNDAGTAMADDLSTHYLSLYANNPVGAQKWLARPKVCFSLLRPIASALCSLYEDPVRYSWKEGEEQWEELFAEIREQHLAFMSDADLYTFLGGTAGGRPMVIGSGGELRIALYTGDQLEGVPDAVDPGEAQQLSVSWTRSEGDSRTTVRHAWTAEEFFATVDDIPLLDEYESQAYPDGRHPYGRIPIVLFYNRRPRWRLFDLPPMDLVNVNRAVNKKATDLDWRMTLSGDVLVTSGWEKNTPPIVGAGAHIDLGQGGSADFKGPDPRVADAVETINLYLRSALMSRRIPENAIMAQQSGESGIKVVADAAALSEHRKVRANAFRPREAEMIRMELFVLSLHRGQRVKWEDVPAPGIVYTMPQVPMSMERMAEWDRKIRLNLATPVDELMDLDPSLTREEAEERIAENATYNRQRQAAPVFDRRAMMQQEPDKTDETDETDETEDEEEDDQGEDEGDGEE